MHPLAPSAPPPGFTSSYWTNDEIILSLDQINHGSPIPDDVIFDNPYQYDPSNFPDGAWFLVRTTEEKETKHGLWRAKGSACEIFANSAISGWRTTFEFSQVQAPIEQKTLWMMQEYKVTPKRQHDQTKLQEFALCRVFSCCNETKPEQNNDLDNMGELKAKSQLEGVGSSLVDKPGDHSDDLVADLDCILRGDYLELNDLVDKPRDFSDDLVADLDCILRGDYLELNDLGDAASDSSSSENSSRLSFASDKCFDSLALLRDLDDAEKKEGINGSGSTDNYNIMMCVISNDVAVQPAPLESLVKRSEAAAKGTQQAPDNNKFKSPIEPSPDQAAKRLKAEHADEGPSHSCRATTSPSSSSSSSNEPGHAATREEKRTKKLMKFLCFMPF